MGPIWVAGRLCNKDLCIPVTQLHVCMNVFEVVFVAMMWLILNGKVMKFFIPIIKYFFMKAFISVK